MATGPQADPNASVRKDYELAMQLGTRDVWEAFLRSYPEGFYADLAEAQLRKVSAEEARTAAAEKARLAEQEKTRLAAEGARQAEQAKAAAAARVAEEARIAAEKAKAVEQEKAAAAERARLAEQEKARIAAEEAAEEKKQQIAALPPSPEKSDTPPPDLPRALQAELRRVGCNTGAIDGNWSAASQKALDLFNKHSGMKLDVKTASADALDAVKGKTGRICICETGYRADGDRCVKITCRTGYQLNDDGACEKIEVKRPTAKREEPKTKQQPSERAKLDAAPARPQTSGQLFCDQQGCRAVRKGCRLEYQGAVRYGQWTNGEVCN